MDDCKYLKYAELYVVFQELSVFKYDAYAFYRISARQQDRRGRFIPEWMGVVNRMADTLIFLFPLYPGSVATT